MEVSTDELVTTAGEVVTTAKVEVSVALTTTTITNDDEVTLANTLIEIKAAKPKAKPKVITTAATIVTAVAIIRHKSKGIVMQEASETLSPRQITSSPKPSQAKDKGKEKMAVMDANWEQAAKLQEEERGELSIEVKSKLFVELINKKKKHFEMLRAIDSGAVTDKAIESSKRAGEELESEKSKKQKLDENVQAEVADDDSAKLKMCMEIVPEDEDDVTVDTTPLSSKSPTIIDYKIHKERKNNYFQIIRADGNSQLYLTFRQMFKNFNREELDVLWSIVKNKFMKAKPVDEMDNLLLRTLKTMFEHEIEDTIWTYQQGLAKVTTVFNKVNAVSSRVTTVEGSYNCWMDKDKDT
ncbi:hypothetical protein Tco_0556612 [Tanacetum coccineum]